MLASAHVLAMDAKNLLDVVDSIRVRYPDLVLPARLQPQPASPTTTTTALTTATTITATSTSGSPSVMQTQQHIVTQTTFQSVPPHIEENTYQNSTFMQHTSPPTSLTHSYETHSVGATASPQVYSNQSGIYDNESIISQQIKNLEVGPQRATKEIIKPPPPIRSSGLVSKIRANFQQQQQEEQSLNETLKIIEDPNEIYSNVQLPEPVSCKIVQENLVQTSQVSGSSAK